MIIILLLASVSLAAQAPLEVRRVSLDELVSFLNREFPEDFYCVRYTEEQATFTVSAPRDKFVQAAVEALKEKGYKVSAFGNARFILHGKSVYTELPSGYFDDLSKVICIYNPDADLNALVALAEACSYRAVQARRSANSGE